jgi:hypothetical protein
MNRTRILQAGSRKFLLDVHGTLEICVPQLLRGQNTKKIELIKISVPDGYIIIPSKVVNLVKHWRYFATWWVAMAQYRLILPRRRRITH